MADNIQHRHRNELNDNTKLAMKKRIIIGLVFALICLPCVFVGWWPFLVLMIAVIGIATYEVARLPSHKFSWAVWAVTFVVMYSLIFWVAIKTNLMNDWKNFDINESFPTLWLSPIALGVMIGAYFTVIVFKKDFTVLDACYLIAMTLLLSLGFQAILNLRYVPFNIFPKYDETFNTATPFFKYCQSALLLFYLLVAVCFNDMGAYFVGVLFGKHKINPRISPKKTWEGFAGGIFFSTLFSLLMGMLCAFFKAPILPFFTLDKWYWILLCSFVLPIAGNLGDFAFSAIKRQFDKKDFSNLLGPHGGILDRIDSILFGAIALAFLVALISNNWSFTEWFIG